MTNEDVVRRLSDLLIPSPVEGDDSLHLIKGVVAAQNSRTPTVYLGGSTVAVPVFCAGAWTVPSNGVTVWVLKSGPVLLMLAQ